MEFWYNIFMTKEAPCTPQRGTIDYEMLFPPALRDSMIMAGWEGVEEIPSFTRIVSPDVAFSINLRLGERLEVDPETREKIERELEIESRFLVPRVRQLIEEAVGETEPTAKILEFKPKDK